MKPFKESVIFDEFGSSVKLKERLEVRFSACLEKLSTPYHLMLKRFLRAGEEVVISNIVFPAGAPDVDDEVPSAAGFES
jgi:hypothetical protein